ncbi:MAG: LamG-like jellyroll fold domain-containing protein, partial [Actinoplanes sp.]
SSATPPAMLPAAAEELVKPTEGEASAAARAAGKPVEVSGKRGGAQETFANPDGTFTQTIHQQPVRVVQSGRWVDVDPTLVARPDGTVGPKAAAIGLSFSAGGDGPFASIERAGRQMSLTWPEKLPAPTLNGETATYAEVLPGTDLVVRASVTGFSQLLVVKNRQAAKNPRLRELTFGFQTRNLTVRDSGEGRLQAVDPATGGTVFEAPTPVMWDSGTAPAAAARSAVAPAAARESARRSEIDLDLTKDSLRLTPDAAMLDDSATRFPVYIDPFVNGTSNTGWTMVDSGYPSEEYWKFDGKSDERIGNCPEDCGRNSQVKRLMFTIPTPYQDNRLSILGATFKISMVHTYDGSARAVSLYRMGAGISSSTNWGNMPKWIEKLDTVSPIGSRTSCTSTNQNVEFDAVSAVRQAAAGNWTTATFGIRSDNESSFAFVKRFCGNATLSVNYNRAPVQPSISNLSMNPGGSCRSGATRPYVSSLPTLFATLTDPDTGDAEPLKAQFRVTWPQNGATQTKTWTSDERQSGSRFQFITADASTGVPNLPENVIASWDVRAWDRETWGPWSSDGSATACEFILDKTRPAGPDVDSADYLPLDIRDVTPACVEDEQWYDGVGRYGTFTFDSAAPDVAKYEYGFDTTPSAANTLTPSALGGPVSVTWMPDSDGSHTIQVRAVDQAGKTSDVTSCSFQVKAGAPAVGEWGLADDAGAAAAADAREANPAQAYDVTFAQPGPGGSADRSARFNGTGSYLETAGLGLVDTGGSFTVSVWAKLDDASRNRVVVSQDGTGRTAFTLGYDAASKRWVLELPTNDARSLGNWRVSGPLAEVGEWVHLAAVNDSFKRTVSLHVNGKAAVTAPRRSQSDSYGAVQIGRRLAIPGYTDYFKGDLADVAVFNRIVTAREINQLVALKPNRLGYWALDTATDTDDLPETPDAVSPEFHGEKVNDLSLRAGAALFNYDTEVFPPPTETALIGAGHLVLDGLNDYAETTVRATTTGSYSVSAWVRLAADCNRDMAVLGQAGTNAAAFTLRCHVEAGMPRWEVVLTTADGTGTPTRTVVFDDQRLPLVSQGGADGQHLALTYNDFLNEVRLYVDGQLAAAGQAPHTETWQAGGGLQVGRTRHNAGWVAPFAGVVDEVRVYEGVLEPTTVSMLANPMEQPDV